MEKIPGKPEARLSSIVAESPTEEEWKSTMEAEIAAAKYSVEWRDEVRAKGDKENADWIPNNHTEQSAEKAEAFYNRLLEIAKTFNASCRIELMAKPHFGRNEAKITFTVNDGGEEKDFVFNETLSIQQENDDHTRDYVMGFVAPRLFPSESKRRPSGFGYEDGWNDNDVKNEFARSAYFTAIDDLASRASE